MHQSIFRLVAAAALCLVLPATGVLSQGDVDRPCGFKIAPCGPGSTCSASDPACPATRGENCLGVCRAVATPSSAHPINRHSRTTTTRLPATTMKPSATTKKPTPIPITSATKKSTSSRTRKTTSSRTRKPTSSRTRMPIPTPITTKPSTTRRNPTPIPITSRTMKPITSRTVKPTSSRTRMPIPIPTPITTKKPSTPTMKPTSSRATTTTRRPRPTSQPLPPHKWEACGGKRVVPKGCPSGHVCVDNPYQAGCGMACDRPGICVRPAQTCGGVAGKACPAGLMCTDDPRDDCWATNGGRDCSGICV